MSSDAFYKNLHACFKLLSTTQENVLTIKIPRNSLNQNTTSESKTSSCETV